MCLFSSCRECIYEMFIFNQDKGKRKSAVSSLCDEVAVGVTCPNPHAITLHQGTSIVQGYFTAYN